MTRLALALLLAVTAVAVVAGPADARRRLTIGMGEQHGTFFGDPRVEELGIRHARLIANYDLAATGFYDAWLDEAHARGVNVLVAFDHHSRRIKHLPSVRTYKRVVKRFRRRYPWVRSLSAWNEANAGFQPTARRPGRAARYYNAMRSVCRRCTIVAADVLDRKGVFRWLRTFRRHARGRPRIWGLHNYADANRGRRRPRRSPTARLARRLPGRVWVTETGGVVAFRRAKSRRFRYQYNEDRAARATKRVFLLARATRKITRVYLYHWRAPAVFGTWDSGLVADDWRARPALEVLRREVNRQRRLRFEDAVPPLAEWLLPGPTPSLPPPDASLPGPNG